MSDIQIFQEEYPSLESYWRSIILFGKNVASYKFALSKSLLELASLEQNIISLEIWQNLLLGIYANTYEKHQNRQLVMAVCFWMLAKSSI